MYFLVWCWEWFGDLLLNCWCCISYCKLCFIIKWLSPPFHLSMSIALYLRHDCGIRVYHFQGRIARRDGYYILRDVSCTANVTIIEGHVVRRDRCMHWYFPRGSRTERQRVCIVKKDMHHYIWHCISWHCTFIIDELEHVFCWPCECFSVKLVTVEYRVVIENV